MLGKLLGVLGCAVLLGALAQPGVAREKAKSGASALTVTGCLAQGAEANQYSIKGDDGKSYDLKSSSINLKEHVGHKVTVSGSPMREKASKAEAKTGTTGTTEENEMLRVRHLTMVSTSCQ